MTAIGAHRLHRPRGAARIVPAVARRISASALLTMILACAGPDPGNSPGELRAALDGLYPDGWRFASVDNYTRSEFKAGETPEWIGGDFDGDGRSDYVAQIVIWKPGHTAGVDSAQMLVALLRRRDSFARQVVSVGGGPSSDAYLAKLSRGTSIRDLAEQSAVELEHDAVHQIFAGKAAMAHVYDDGRWRGIVTGD